MKRLLIVVFAFFCLTIGAQKNMTLDQIKSQWTTKSLKVAGGNGTNILQLFEVFQKAWPTYTGGELLKFAKSKVPYGNNDKIVDIKNGYVEYSEDDPDSENDEQLQACVWRRSNGHSLLAVSLHRFSSEAEVLCFYDYNPQTKTLTPEKSLANIFTPSFPGYRYRVLLPRNDKDLKVMEFFGVLTIEHHYSWDGMKPVNPQVSIERIDSYRAVFAENVFFAEEHPLTHYTLVDIDEDGFPELWLRSADSSYQAVFSTKLTMEYLGGQDDRRMLTFYKGAVCDSGNCGTGCISSRYKFVENSCFKTSIINEQEYDMIEGAYPVGTFRTNDGSELSEAEGTRIIDSLGEEIKPNANWVRLAR